MELSRIENNDLLNDQHDFSRSSLIKQYEEIDVIYRPSLLARYIFVDVNNQVLWLNRLQQFNEINFFISITCSSLISSLRVSLLSILNWADDQHVFMLSRSISCRTWWNWAIQFIAIQLGNVIKTHELNFHDAINYITCNAKRGRFEFYRNLLVKCYQRRFNKISLHL